MAVKEPFRFPFFGCCDDYHKAGPHIKGGPPYRRPAMGHGSDVRSRVPNALPGSAGRFRDRCPAHARVRLSRVGPRCKKGCAAPKKKADSRPCVGRVIAAASNPLFNGQHRPQPCCPAPGDTDCLAFQCLSSGQARMSPQEIDGLSIAVSSARISLRTQRRYTGARRAVSFHSLQQSPGLPGSPQSQRTRCPTSDRGLRPSGRRVHDRC
jgi:hypothetical protein